MTSPHAHYAKMRGLHVTELDGREYVELTPPLAELIRDHDVYARVRRDVATQMHAALLSVPELRCHRDEYAKQAVQHADALLAELAKEPSK